MVVMAGALILAGCATPARLAPSPRTARFPRSDAGSSAGGHGTWTGVWAASRRQLAAQWAELSPRRRRPGRPSREGEHARCQIGRAVIAVDLGSPSFQPVWTEPENPAGRSAMSGRARPSGIPVAQSAAGGSGRTLRDDPLEIFARPLSAGRSSAKVGVDGRADRSFPNGPVTERRCADPHVSPG